MKPKLPTESEMAIRTYRGNLDVWLDGWGKCFTEMKEFIANFPLDSDFDLPNPPSGLAGALLLKEKIKAALE